jgi:hypothetical protein
MRPPLTGQTMLERLKRLTKDHDGLPKVPFMKQDMDKIMEKISANIETLEANFNNAVRIHADACLAATEGSPDAAKARDKAQMVFSKAERALSDARAAHSAAERRKVVEDERAKSDALAERQKRAATLQKQVANTCKTLDDLMDRVAEEAITLRDQTKDLRLEGIKDAQTPVTNLSRALGSRLRRTGVPLGSHHPFDEEALKLIDLCPDLKSVIAVIGKKK